jgi:HSP20 family molecular chaperone IbpA
MSSALIERTEQNNMVQADSNRARVLVPRADIYESGETIVILADMPGVTEETVDVTLERNILSIYGKTSRSGMDGFKLLHSDYEQGDFRRVFSLSNEIDREGIVATVKNGVLKLVLPKSKKAVPRKIEVSAI